MDQLTAYKILGLDTNSTLEEVKEAYATLSKQFHPEEFPEEFQKIHEAYVTLTRHRNRVKVQSPYHEGGQTNPNFERLQEEYSFEAAMQKAEMEENEKSHEMVLEAAAEIKLLVSPKYKNDFNAFKSFFNNKKYEAIIRRADFLEKLCDVLEESKLMKSLYQYVMHFYRLKGADPSKLDQIEQRLYHILDEKIGKKKSVSPGVYGGVIAGILAGIRAAKPSIYDSQVFLMIILLTLLVVAVVWAFKKLRKSRSVLLAQAIIASILAVSQFIVAIFELYGTLFGTVDDGIVVAILLMLAALVWLVIIIVITVIKTILRQIKKDNP